MRAPAPAPALALVAALAASLAPATARAWRPSREPDLFFAVSAGSGVAWVDHPQIAPDPRAGVTWDIVFGWRLAPRWSLAVALTTWQTTFLGTPSHLHTLAPRLELGPAGVEGPFAVGALGLGMTDGDVSKQAGVAASLFAGYRWWLAPGYSLAAQAGAHAQAYFLAGDGGAVEPFVGLELRVHGWVGR